jgi:hypothetical protein
VWRRACLLRAEGHAIEARRVEETEVAPARAALAPGLGADADRVIGEFLREEEDRVAGAVAFMEALRPELTALAETRPAPNPVIAKAALRPRAAERGIADFIDEMLAQQSPPPR